MKKQQTLTKAVKPFTSPPKLTRKQQAFVTHILEHPKDSATEAAVQSYNANNRLVAKSIATENLSKPAIVMALGKANDRVEQVLMTTVDEYGNSDKLGQRSLAIDTAKYIHDKIHGKAKQQMEINTSSISLTIDLTSALGDVIDA